MYIDTFDGSWLPQLVASTLDLGDLVPQSHKSPRLASGITIIGGLGDLIFDQFNQFNISIDSVSFDRFNNN